MRRRMTLEQYRTADVCIFTTLMCICEMLIVLAGTRWFPAEPYTLSLVPAVTALLLVRWGAFAAVPAIAGAAVFCVLSGAGTAQALIYCVGNLAALLLVPAVRGEGWKRLHDNVVYALAYGLAAAVLMQTGRFAAALALGHAPGVCAGFFTTDVLSVLFSMLIIWICRRLDGMLEEQRHYLIRVQKEMKEAGGINA